MVLYRLIHAIWFALIVAASPFVGKVRRGLRGRRGLTGRVARATAGWERPYWFHFASSGEFEQAIPILDALRARVPNCRIFLTYFSPTGRRAVELETQRRARAGRPVPWDAADFSPYDFPLSVRAFLQALNPRSLTVLNREFWPETFEACFSRGIPVRVFAAYFSRRARRALPFYRPWLERLSFLGTTDEATARFLREQITSPIESLGDPRIERVLERRRLGAEGDKLVPEGTRVFVGASLWPEDFAALGPTLRLLASHPTWRLFLVPHEPEERFLSQMEAWLAQNGIACRRWSQHREEKASDSAPRVVLVDSVGWLAELYRFATLAFVGGSFKARVHSVLEPAAYAVPILTGPHIHNSLEAVEMRGSGLASAQTAQELLGLVEARVDGGRCREQGDEALAYLVSRSGAGSRYVERLF